MQRDMRVIAQADIYMRNLHEYIKKPLAEAKGF